MNRLFKYKNGEIKVFWNETPMHKDYEESLLVKELSKKTKKVEDSFAVGVELKINKGGRICYGMLRARMQPIQKYDTVNLSIAYTHRNTVRYEDSFLINDKYVYKGLPEEYISQVFCGISSAIDEKAEYLQCDIFFDYAANCEVGSSPMIFGLIAEMLINIVYESSYNELANITIADFTKKYLKKITLNIG